MLPSLSHDYHAGSNFDVAPPGGSLVRSTGARQGDLFNTFKRFAEVLGPGTV